MTAEEIIQALKAAIPDLQAEVVPAGDRPTITLPREQLIKALTVLRDAPSLRFMELSDVTAVDWWPGEPRFQVVYHLASLQHLLQLRIKVPLAGDDAHIPTVSHLWAGANWGEREVFDLFGIIFDGHPDLRRVLMPEDWEGYPLRKDYPVQIKLPVKFHEPIGMTAEQFKENIERDRVTREK